MSIQDTQPGVVHSIGRSFATWGCGYIAYQGAMAAHRAGILKQVITTSHAVCDIPDEMISDIPGAADFNERSKIPYRIRNRFRLDYFLVDNAFDLKARRAIEGGSIFHGWTHQAYFQMKKAKRLGMRTVLERPNTHPLEMTELVDGERRKFGVNVNSEGPFENLKCMRELSLADRIVVCSHFAKDSHIRHGVPEEKIRVINYGVDTDIFTPGEKSDSKFRVIYCGLVCLRKGPQYLLQAWQELALKDAELWLIGPVTPDMVGVMKQYENLPGLSIKGFVEDSRQLADMYRQGSVFVFPSVEDGFGMVVTEAMACGVPVIISDNTGARDVVQDGINGFVIPTYDIEQMKTLILQFKNDPSMSRTLGAAARRTAMDNTWYHYSDKLLSVYRELL